LSFVTASIPADRNAWQLLPNILQSSQTKKFLFIGPEAVLSPNGAAEVSKVLAGELAEPTFLAIEQLGGRDMPSITRGGHLFAWNAKDFQRFWSVCPPPLVDFSGRNGMDAGQYVDWPMSYEPHAYSLGGTSSNALYRRLNDRIQKLFRRTEGVCQ
jgi:hypothetical protein